MCKNIYSKHLLAYCLIGLQLTSYYIIMHYIQYQVYIQEPDFNVFILKRLGVTNHSAIVGICVIPSSLLL